MVPSTGLNKFKTAVFNSGTGSNLKSLIKFSKTKKSPISISLIVSNNPKAKGLNFANTYKIKKKIYNFKYQKLAEKKILFEMSREFEGGEEGGEGYRDEKLFLFARDYVTLLGPLELLMG